MEKKYRNTDHDHYEILQQFRRNLKDVLKPQHTDEYLLIWLRARNFDLGKAEMMLRVALNMRSLYQIDRFATDFRVTEVLEKYNFVTFLGFDKEGSPVRCISIRNADLIGFVMSLSTFEIGCYAEYILETDRHFLEEENKRTGRTARGSIYIFDMADFTLHQLLVKPVIETGLDLVKIFQELHPEDVKAIYCVNAPTYFSVAFNLFKPILRLNLLQRIHVYSKDSVPEKLLMMVDQEVLPHSIGGSRVDPDGDPLCPSIVNFGGKIPEDFYKMNREYLQENHPGVKTVQIRARSFYDIATVVENAGSILRVEFRSEHYSIGLCLLYKPLPLGFITGDGLNRLEIEKDGGNEPKLISVQARIQSHIAPVDESIFCDFPGIYILHFDNTFSLLHSKRILYRTEVFPPNETNYWLHQKRFKN